MSYALNGIKNFLQIIYDNWFILVAIFGLCLGIYKKISVFFNKTTEQKIEIAKIQVREGILKMITDAETDYDSWVKAGEIKRSQVIKQIYTDYPILEKVVDQEELIDWMDNQIKEALKSLRKIVAETKAEEKAIEEAKAEEKAAVVTAEETAQPVEKTE